MAVRNIRPWGLLNWVLDRIPNLNWSVIGCLSTENRCLSAWDTLKARSVLENLKLFKITDPPSRYTSLISTKINDRRNEFISQGGRANEIEDHHLFEPAGKIVSALNAVINKGATNILLDITCFPKRFFFPITKLLLQDGRISNLLVTYTVPASYAHNALVEDPEPWLHIPLFPPAYPEVKAKAFIVCAGFEPLGLPHLEEDYRNLSIKLLAPFPPGPPSFQRVWQFVRSLEENGFRNRTLIPVDAKDTSDAFDHICSATESGRSPAIFAPYGPKPLSLAVAIYASLRQSPVYYTQPRVYNPDYSTGVAFVNGMPETYAYLLRANGNNYYSL